MVRRRLTKWFKFEAVKLVTDRATSVAQAARDLGLAESVLRWSMREASAAPVAAVRSDGRNLAAVRLVDSLRPAWCWPLPWPEPCG